MEKKQLIFHVYKLVTLNGKVYFNIQTNFTKQKDFLFCEYLDALYVNRKHPETYEQMYKEFITATKKAIGELKVKEEEYREYKIVYHTEFTKTGEILPIHGPQRRHHFEESQLRVPLSFDEIILFDQAWHGV